MRNTENQINIPMSGMDRDSHPSRVKENTFTFANNISLEDSSGNGYPIVQNEPSNILCQDFKDTIESRFGEGAINSFKIVGHRYYTSLDRTYMFLTNEDRESEFFGTSVIGYIHNQIKEIDSYDQEEDCGCKTVALLDSPLEGQAQESICTFKLVAEDSCSRQKGADGTWSKGCLNLSLSNPIYERNIRFKSEQCGRRMYWTDRVNPPRYLDLDLIETGTKEENYYFYDNFRGCGLPDPTYDTPCLDCEKLKMIPDYDIPCILPKGISLGGGLKMGTYEFLIAYCDEDGNELSSYYSHTSPVNIFNSTNLHMDQTQLADTTNYAIELEVSNLDDDFRFFKVAVIQHTDVNGEESYFEEGIHPISDKTVLYTSERNKKRITLNKLLVKRLKIQSVEQMIDSNGYMFMAGLKNKPVLNMQPIVSLLGPYVKWTTTIAEQDFYKDGVNASLYRSYMRDEVYPLSIVFGLADGSETPQSILINRAAQTFNKVGDKDKLKPSDPNYASFISSEEECVKVDRTERWQFENTARLMGESSIIPRCLTKEDKLAHISKLEGNGTFFKDSIKTCTVFDMVKDGLSLNVLESGKLKIGGDYRANISFTEYVNKNLDLYKDLSGSFYSGDLSYLLKEDRYKEFNCQTTDACNCKDDEEPIHQYMEIVEADLINPVETYKTSLEPIEKLKYIETQFPENIREEDYRLTSKYLKQGFGSIHLRPSRFSGNSCTEPETIKVYQDTVVEEEEGYIIPVIGTVSDKEDYSGLLYSNFKSTPTEALNYPILLNFQSGEPITRASGTKCRVAREEWNYLRGNTFFPDKVSRNALWLKTVDIFNNPYLQINTESAREVYDQDSGISDNNLTKESDVAYNKLEQVRVSIFEKCSVKDQVVTPLKVIFVKKGSSELLDLKKLTGRQSGEFLVAIDTPIIRLYQYAIQFSRWYDKVSVGYANGETVVPDKYKLYSFKNTFVPKLNKSIELVTFFNIDKDGRAGTPRGDSDCASSKEAFIEANFYGITSYYPSKQSDYKDGYKLLNDSAYITSSTDNSIMVLQRGKEVDYTTYDIRSIRAVKKQDYNTRCYYEKLRPCDNQPFEEGMFAYHESTQTYPDNEYLFNSAKAFSTITESKFDKIVNKYKTGTWDGRVFSGSPLTIKDVFKANFSTPRKFVDSSKADFTCKPIRHFKFPSNSVSPFLYTNESMEFQDTYIFPLGLSLDSRVVNIFLDLAVESGQLSKKDRDSITYFKIMRGDRTLEKTILAKGLFTDVIKYTDIGRVTKHFVNFPFNSFQNKELLSGDGYIVKHPYNGKMNNKFAFNSPEVDLGLTDNPTEIIIDGYQYGTAENQINQLEDHSKMVLLSSSAITTADRLATTESMFEVISKTAELGIGAAQAFSGGGFLGFSGVAAGAIAGGLAAAVVSLRAPMISNRTAELRNKWIEIFKNQGIGVNFAYTISAVGDYNNYSSNIRKDSQIRRVYKSTVLNSGLVNVNEPTQDGFIKLNNIDREKSLFLYLGDRAVDNVKYTPEFSSIDKSNREPGAVSTRETYSTDIANLYGAIKIWKPDQYGDIGNIRWVDITGCNYLDNEDSTNIMFGGDVFISKYAYKKKFNFFLVSGMLQADFTPYKYSRYFNIGRPKYYVDYETEASKYGKSMITTPSSKYQFDPATTIEQGNYITEGRFYHYQYGIPYFFVESTINSHLRYAGKEPWENFYPNASDYVEWTQEKNVSIRRPNVFKYNYSYSRSGVPKSGTFLPNNYVPKFYDCINNSPNGVMYSSMDNSEKQKVDPWLIYKHFDFYNFPTSNGKLINLLNIESAQILGLFENKMSLFNTIDVLKERVSPETAELGSGGIFAQRPKDFSTTDNGYGGTQHKSSVSCEFGHFYVDARRGQVFQLDPNGGNITEITIGLRNWFKEHLPFKILKGNIKGLTDLDLDNPYKNLGIAMGFDSRFKRVFLTKLDYIVNPQYVGKIEYVFREGFEEEDVNLDFLSVNKYFRFIDTKEEVLLSDRKVFTPVPFTLAYSPIFKSWISYYNFTPGFYIGYNNYFATGGNFTEGPSVWSHLLTNKSYGVFYGKKYPWTVEVPTKNQFVNKSLNNIEFKVDSIRYHNAYDYAVNTNLGLDYAWVYNNTDSSGMLKLIPREMNNRFQETQYPKTGSGNTEILASFDEGKWSFNDFFNRTAYTNSNVPLWLYDKNSIYKTQNFKALTYTQTWLDRLKGEWFLIRMEGGSDTRFKQMFKMINPEDNIII